MTIDFHRVIENVQDTIETGKLMLMSEQQRNDYMKQRVAAAEKRHYEEGEPHSSARQLAMLKHITTPLVRNNGMKFLQETTEVGGYYQPSLKQPLVFVPQYNDHVGIYYKGHRLFDMEFKDENGQTIAASGIKSATIVDQKAKLTLARISNLEWDQMIADVVPEMIKDINRPMTQVLIEKADTAYINKLDQFLKGRAVETAFDAKENDVYKENHPMSSDAQVKRISDEDLTKMYAALVPNQESELNDLEFGE